MATLLEYYKTDFDIPLRLESHCFGCDLSGLKQSFDVSTFVDLAANAKYLAFYFPKETFDGRLLLDLLSDVPTFFGKANEIRIGKRVQAGFMSEIRTLDNNQVQLSSRLPGDLEKIDSDETMFTGRVFIYHENPIPPDSMDRLYKFAQAKGLMLICRGPQYVEERNRMEKPRAFISHDSRDKEAIARPIATRLRNMLCPVWYDEFSLNVGDSLRESIESGLKACHMCVFLLTPNFLLKGGWPKREYDTIFTRELIEEKKLILPVWAGVDRDDVYEYSPILADRVAVQWELGEEEVCRRLLVKLMP